MVRDILLQIGIGVCDLAGICLRLPYLYDLSVNGHLGHAHFRLAASGWRL